MNKLQEAFIKANYKKYGNRELADLFNKTFGTNKSVRTVDWYKKQLNLKKCARGHGNDLPIGTERIKEGYSVIKVASNPSVWKYKHRWIYEQAFGKIPKNHHVIFLDGDKTNCSLDNLALVDNKVAMLMKAQHLHSNCKEVTETGMLLAKLQMKQTELTMTKVDEGISGKELRSIRSLEYYHRNKDKINARRRVLRKSSSYREQARIYQKSYRLQKKTLKNNDTTL